MIELNIEKIADKNEKEFGMGSVEEVKAHTENKVVENKEVDNAVKID